MDQKRRERIILVKVRVSIVREKGLEWREREIEEEDDEKEVRDRGL